MEVVEEEAAAGVAEDDECKKCRLLIFLSL